MFSRFPGTFAILLVSLVWATAAHAAEPATPVDRTWKIDGVERTAIIYAPTNAKTEKHPLLFAFHGHGGTAKFAARRFGFQNLWPEAIVVYMQGLPTPGLLTDPQGLKDGWQSAEGLQGNRDLKFFDMVLADVKKDYKVEDRQIFATGHSNGGGFTYVLWANRPSVFAAFAPAAAIPGRNAAKLTPKPVMHIAGEKDPLVRYAWQERTIANECKLDGCDDTGKAWAHEGTSTATVYGSKTGTPFVSVVHTGGHELPNETFGLIVKFFKEQIAAKPKEQAAR